MKTIVQIVQHLRPGGIETMALELDKFFAARGDRSYIVSLEGSPEAAMAAWPRLKQHRQSIVFLDKPEKFSLPFLLRVFNKLKKLNCSVLHTHHIGPLLYGGFAARMLGLKVHVHTEHDAWHLENSRQRSLQRWLLRISRPKLVADADSVGEALTRFLDVDDLTVIRNGIDTDRFTPGDSRDARHRLGLPLTVGKWVSHSGCRPP